MNVYKFSELFTYQSGKSIAPEGGKIPVYGSNGVIGFTDKIKYRNKIIIGRVGANCGSVMYCNTDFNATDNTLITTCDESKILYQFAYYLLKQYGLNKFSGGSAQPLLTQGYLNPLKCVIPNISIQERIIRILSKYDEAIENNNKRIKLLEQMAQNLYKEWFVRFRFPGWQNAEFENGIPKGWKYRKIGECGEIIGGGTPSTEIEEYWGGNIPWLTPADLSTFEYVYIKEGANNITDLGLRKSSAKLMPKNTVLLSSRAPVGYVAIAQNEISTNQGFKSVICNDKVLNYAYLFYFFKLNTIALQNFATGATFPELSGSMLKRIKILLPEIKLQNKFCTMVTPLFEEINILAQKTQNLSRQRDLLLPRLMSGKLQVLAEKTYSKVYEDRI